MKKMILNITKATLVTMLFALTATLQSCSDDDDNAPSESQETIISYKIDGQLFEYTKDDITWGTIEYLATDAAYINGGNDTNGISFSYFVNNIGCDDLVLNNIEFKDGSIKLYAESQVNVCIEVNTQERVRGNFSGVFKPSPFVDFDLENQMESINIIDGYININFEDITLINN